MNSRYEGPHHVTDGRSALVTEEWIEDGQEDEDHQKRINGQSSHDENESKSE